MEENQQSERHSQEISSGQGVGFPPQSPKKNNNKLLIILVAVVGTVLIVGVGLWFILQTPEEPDSRNAGDELTTLPTPGGVAIETPSPTPSPTPASLLSKTQIRISVLNGTGTPGEAGAVRDELVEIGFDEDNIQAGNASEQNYTSAEVTFSSSVSEDIREEVLEVLNRMFSRVTSKVGDVQDEDFDILIITGSQRGSTPSPSPSS